MESHPAPGTILKWSPLGQWTTSTARIECGKSGTHDGGGEVLMTIGVSGEPAACMCPHCDLMAYHTDGLCNYTATVGRAAAVCAVMTRGSPPVQRPGSPSEVMDSMAAAEMRSAAHQRIHSYTLRQLTSEDCLVMGAASRLRKGTAARAGRSTPTSPSPLREKQHSSKWRRLPHDFAPSPSASTSLCRHGSP